MTNPFAITNKPKLIPTHLQKLPNRTAVRSEQEKNKYIIVAQKYNNCADYKEALTSLSKITMKAGFEGNQGNYEFTRELQGSLKRMNPEHQKTFAQEMREGEE